MFRLRDLSVRGKVLLIVGIGIVLQVIVAGTGLFYLNLSNKNLVTTIDTEADAIWQAVHVRAAFFDMIIFEKNMIMVKDEGDKAGHLAAFEESRRELDRRLRALRETAGSLGTGQVNDFTNEYGEYLKVHLRIRLLSEKHDDAAAEVLSTGASREHADRARAALLNMMDGLNAALEQRKIENGAGARTAMSLMVGVLLATLIVALGLGLVVTRAITSGLGKMVAVADAIAGGKLDNEIAVGGSDEIARLASAIDRMQAALRAAQGESDAMVAVADAIADGKLDNEIAVGGSDEIAQLASAIDRMQAALRAARDESTALDWLKTGLTRLNDLMRGELPLGDLANKVIGEMTTYLDAKVGAFYMMGEEGGKPCLSLLGSYAYTHRKNLSNRFEPGEGLVGQAALEREQILISNVPDDYIKVTSGLGDAIPRHICVTPLLFEDRVKGVIEVATLGPLSERQLEYLSQTAPAVAVTIETAHGRECVRLALEESQRLTEALQAQQEEMSVTNEELEEQTQRLKSSEARLQAQQEEMSVTNEELAEKNELLERQKQAVELARRDIAKKADELALASKYKSEFLANMSHELRTPLNSLLLLARSLLENRDKNLTAQQVESARVIHQAGNDLLSLINEILDLSKIEAGRMDLKPREVLLDDIAASMRDAFSHLAEERGLAFEVVVDGSAPKSVVTDRQRIDQVIRNLVSNAIKFTEKGSVTVTFGMPDAEVDLRRSGLHPATTLAITVRDTGIGIAPDKHLVIFEAFQQVDGGASRKFGGTGLGLSISRELVRLLGGEILLQSEPGKGSTFTVCLPTILTLAEKTAPRVAPDPPCVDAPVSVSGGTKPSLFNVPDDREVIGKDDNVILLVEDDARFAEVLVHQSRERGLKCLAAGDGETGLALARRYVPQGIVLDLKLPGLDGWAVLQRLKDDPTTRHIPVHIMSVEEQSNEALRKGAIGHLRKPVTREEIDAALGKLEETAARRVKNVLVVEDDDEVRRSIVKLIADDQVNVDEAAGAKPAIEALRAKRYDCMILDLGLVDMDGGQLLRHLDGQKEISVPPVIVYTARDLTREEEMALLSHSEAIIIKDVRSQERLLDEVSLFLHRVVAEMPEPKRQVITNLHDPEGVFRGKKVLIVDDDMRTLYALSSILSDRGITAVKAENGERAIKTLSEQPDVDLVLMDVMMPVLDGIDTMRRIRAEDRFRKLPIIVLTAKAMKGDKERCMAAGASDYLPKPIDQDRLLSMMRVWLYR